MMNILKGMALSLTSALLIATFSAPVSAGFIDGDITFSGNFTPIGFSGGLGDATGIDFQDTTPTNFVVFGATDDFADAGIVFGTGGLINDFSFSPIFSPVDPLWTVGGFSFKLDSLTIDTQNSTELTLLGAGTITKTGYEATAGTWSLTANNAGGSDALFIFSSGATAVPLPAAAWLFGSVVIGFVGLRRKRA